MNETKRERLFDGVTGIRDDLVEEAAAIPAKRNRWQRWVAAAACMCLVLAGVMAALRSGTENDLAQISPDAALTSPLPQVITSYGSAGATASCYKAPEPGEHFCFADLDTALADYAGQDVLFFVGIDMFSADGVLDDGGDAMTAELERLRGLGLDVGYAQAWGYQGTEAEHVTYTYAAGCLTAEQLQNFPVNPDYGYAFHFQNNGDGSAPTAEQQNIVTDYPTDSAA